MPKISIVIPTCKSENLIPCLKSITKYTDLTDTEVIIVANGYDGIITDEFRAHGYFKIVEFPEMIGYPAAINAGAAVAKGDYLLLLNDDTILLEQPKNAWIEILLRAFWDEKCAVSGPWMNWCPWAEHEFLLFFCVMIRRNIFEQLGGLDVEAFTDGYGEDCDFCCRTEAAGFRNVQVPVGDKLPYDGRMALGQFPIYHAGNKTFTNWPGGEELLAKNRAILKERYSTNIGKAKALDGWMSDAELRWLAQRARQSKVFVQVGAWHGKSSRAIADNLPPDGKLYDIDAWTGSNAELDTNHWSARLLDGDHAFDEYARGMWDHLASGKVTPLKMRGKNGAALLRDMGIKADTVFIDGGHGPGETREDINWFLPLRKDGGIIAGHDYMHPDGMWNCVGPEVKEVFGSNIGNPEGTSIWYTDASPTPKIYDCFPFNNELDILEFRLKELYPVVDRFVIVEAKKTHSGKPKELVFDANKERFGKYLHKISYIMLDDLPEIDGTITDKSWARERHQRDGIMRGLTMCNDNDIIIISDCDEVPNPAAIKSYNGSHDVRSFDMELYYYSMRTKATESWREAKIATYKKVKEMTPCGVRYAKAEPIPDGGIHMSYFGSVDQIIQKIENTAHVEYDTPEYKDWNRIMDAIVNHKDLFGRPNVQFVKA